MKRATRKNTAPSTKRPAKPKFKAALTEEQVKKIEQNAQAGGIARRVALAVLARDASKLLEVDDKGAEAFLNSTEWMKDRLDWLAKEHEIIETAQARIFLVLQYLYPSAAATAGGSGHAALQVVGGAK